jgi:hypothetical protein
MQDIGDFIHEIGIGMLITHRPGGKLAAWPLRVVPEGRAVWREGARKEGEGLPLKARFIVRLEAALIRQVTDCPRVGATFQDGHRYCFLSGLARIAQDSAAPLLEMEVLAAEYRELPEAEDLWGRSLDVTRRA